MLSSDVSGLKIIFLWGEMLGGGQFFHVGLRPGLGLALELFKRRDGDLLLNLEDATILVLRYRTLTDTVLPLSVRRWT